MNTNTVDNGLFSLWFGYSYSEHDNFYRQMFRFGTDDLTYSATDFEKMRNKLKEVGCDDLFINAISKHRAQKIKLIEGYPIYAGTANALSNFKGISLPGGGTDMFIMYQYYIDGNELDYCDEFKNKEYEEDEEYHSICFDTNKLCAVRDYVKNEGWNRYTINDDSVLDNQEMFNVMQNIINRYYIYKSHFLLPLSEYEFILNNCKSIVISERTFFNVDIFAQFLCDIKLYVPNLRYVYYMAPYMKCKEEIIYEKNDIIMLGIDKVDYYKYKFIRSSEKDVLLNNLNLNYHFCSFEYANNNTQSEI